MHRLSIIRGETARIFIEDWSHVMVVTSHEWLNDVFQETLIIDGTHVKPKYFQFSIIVFEGRKEPSHAVLQGTGQALGMTKFDESVLPIMHDIHELVIRIFSSIWVGLKIGRIRRLGR